MKSTLIMAFAAIAAMPSAHAQVFGSGQLYGGPAQSVAYCIVFNGGNKAVTLTNLAIFDEGGADVSHATSCTTTLGARKGCTIDAYPDSSTPVSCAVQVGKSAALSGSLEIRDGNDNVMVAQQMR